MEVRIVAGYGVNVALCQAATLGNFLELFCGKVIELALKFFQFLKDSVGLVLSRKDLER